MIRGFFRLVGLLLLAGGFIFMVYDGARWVADQTLRFTPFGEFWNDIHQSSLQAFRAWLEGAAPWLWSSVVKVILDQPVFAVMGVLGILLAAVPAAQAPDRLFPELSGAVPCGVFVQRPGRNRAAAAGAKTYIRRDRLCVLRRRIRGSPERAFDIER